MYFIKVDLWPNIPSVFRFRYDRDMINWRYGMTTYKHYMLSCVNLIIISIVTHLLWLIFLCYFNPILIHKHHFLYIKRIIIQPRSKAQEPRLVYFENNNYYDNNNYDNNSNNYNSNVNNTTNSNGNSNSDNNNNNKR
jgi:hypothetical protein